MKIIPNWQYKYIEKSLFNYYQLLNSTLETERKMVIAINEAMNYFKGTFTHETMIREYYFNAHKHLKKYTKAGHYTHVCLDLIHTEEPNGYVIRREIV